MSASVEVVDVGTSSARARTYERGPHRRHPGLQRGRGHRPVLDRIFDAVESDCEIYVVVDFEEDSTVPVLAAYREHEPRLKTLVNTMRPRPGQRHHYGIDQVKTPVAVARWPTA